MFEEAAIRFERAASLVPELIDKAIQDTEEQLLDLNRSQLRTGTKADGQKITPKYERKYAEKKKKKGSKSSPTPDLFVKGDFYQSFKAKLSERQIEIEGTVRTDKGFDLAGHLEKRYTSEIYGLTDPNKVRYSKVVKPEFMKLLIVELNG